MIRNLIIFHTICCWRAQEAKYGLIWNYCLNKKFKHAGHGVSSDRTEGGLTASVWPWSWSLAQQRGWKWEAQWLLYWVSHPASLCFTSGSLQYKLSSEAGRTMRSLLPSSEYTPVVAPGAGAARQSRQFQRVTMKNISANDERVQHHFRMVIS